MKYRSETTGLESKAQLDEYRKKRCRQALVENGLDTDFQFLWSVENKVLAQQLWDDTAVEDAQRKTELRTKVEKLSADDRAKYFNEIGVVDQGNLGSWLG